MKDAATQSATNETDGIKVQTRYSPGNPYSYQLTSNPYRANYSYNAGGEPSMGWTQSKAINTGKHSEAETFSGAALPTAFGGNNTSSTGKVQTDTDAERTLVTDQAGKQRISKSNALGQLTDIWEITASDSATVAVTFPNQTIAAGYWTSYVYDTLNNLTTVNQGSQVRTFSYSSLSRLLTAANPESGTIGYQYDNNGNLSQKTDARSIAANYSYDALNRVTQRSYANEPTGQTTPTVTYTYDTLPSAKGKLTKVSSSVSETEYTEFDIMGRVKAHKQTTDGQIYTTGYVYNLSGALIEETYPSTRVVKNVLDTDGDLSMVQSKQNANTGFYNYADSFTYTSAGAVSSMQLGNGKWESTSFNSRLQPTQIALGTVQNGFDKLKLNYTYGGTDNNGNVQSQTITVPTVGVNPGFTATQSYAYDNLNRLQSATETVPTQTWKQTFLYDRYGNRNFDTTNNNTTTIPTGCSTAQCNPSISATNNRFNSGQGYSYDLNGNVVTDAQGRTFTFDGENKQKSVSDNTSTIGTYFYDGDGKRVKKVTNSETTIFVYDAGGKLVAEYSNLTPQNPQVSYLTNDHLGSPRITTDANGNVLSRRDFHPFGEEVYTAQRTTGLGYTADNVKQKFTGYIRDDETDLDFAQARMFGSSLGRFTSPDPYNIILESKAEKNQEKAEAKLNSYLSKPQQWNRYVYVSNNPLIYVDPNGETLELTGTQKERDKAFNKILDLCGKKCEGKLYIEEKDGHTFVKYFDNKGGLSGNAAQIGQVLEDIINSDTNVELQVTSKQTITWSDGKTENISIGAKTRHMTTKSTQIFINDSVSPGVVADSAAVLGVKTIDDTKLIMTESTILAHELGHAWGGIKDNFLERYNKSTFGGSIRSENDTRSLQVENWQRDRLGLSRRANH